MPSIDPSSLSSDQRPVRLRKRSDLVVSPVVFQGQRCHVVKDPIGMKYFRLRQAEYVVFSMLDGAHSYRDITNRLQKEFPEQTFRRVEVQQLVNSLHESGLLLGDGAGQAAPLQRRHRKQQRQKLIGALSSIITIRFPGVDPTRFLNWLYPKTRWFFSAPGTAVNLAILLSAMLLVLTQLDEFSRRLPEFQQFFGFQNLLFMAFVLIVTKSIHELGHGLMCKHFGGECHEIGFMLLVMTPAMYCNTSDSWILPNKWHRIAIGAAGMYVELVLASIATFVWWYTNPGWFHYLCLNIMFLSSVSTIVFNANPLLRYDGYYMLSDFLEIPNLATKSRQAMISKLRTWCLGMKPVPANQLPHRNQVAFAFYSVASFLYRWFVLLMIFWFMKEIFEPWGLAVVGHLLISVALIGMLAMPAYQLCRFFSFPGRFREVKKFRTACSAIALALAILAIGWIPVPHNVSASFVIRPDQAQSVYVDQPGLLIECRVRPMQRVKEGELLAVLENSDLQLQVLELQGRLRSLESELASYQTARDQFGDSASRLGEIGKQIAATERELAIRQRQADSLRLVADRDGVILPPPNVVATPVADRLTLVSWSGTPLDKQNAGAMLLRETTFCYVGDPDRWRAELIVDQSDQPLLKPGQPVQLVCEQFRDQRIESQLSAVSSDELEAVPRELSQTFGGPIAIKPGPGDSELPMLNSYRATAKLHNVSGIQLWSGFHGTAKIRVGESSLGARFWRQIMTVVNFR